MSVQDIRELVAAGKLSAEQGARMLELHYRFRRLARRARLRRWASNILLAPLRWLGLTRLR